jgi:hypothetical protein
MKISYAITVCDESTEIQRLISFLLEFKRVEDEIVVLFDESKNCTAVEEYLRSHSINGEFSWHKGKFEGHFADWKNKLNSLCSGDVIINLDADEIPNPHLIENLPFILENNESDIILVPRINTVQGIGLSHIQKWGWKVSKLENMKEEKIFDLSNPKDLDEYNLLKQNNLIIEERVISSK